MRCFDKVWISLTIGILAGCASSPVVQTKRDPSADFSAYRSYLVRSTGLSNSGGYSSSVTDSVSPAINDQLKAKGYTLDESNPDLTVTYRLSTKPRTDKNIGQPGPAGRTWGPEYVIDPNAVLGFATSELTISVIDNKTQKVVWDGSTSTPLIGVSLDAIDPRIQEAVGNILAKLPTP